MGRISQGNRGRKNRDAKLIIKCFAFAGDLTILSNNRKYAQQVLKYLHEIAAKAGLEISCEKAQYMESKNSGTQIIQTSFGEIRTTEKFRYLGEINKQENQIRHLIEKEQKNFSI